MAAPADECNDQGPAGEGSFIAEEALRSHFWRYFVACTSSTLAISALTILLWSSMGMGQVAIDWLQTNDWLWYPTTAAYVVILMVLLPLDFFRPPHIPGEYLRLWKTDVIIGRGLFGIAIVCFYVSCLFMAGKFQSVPLVMTIVLAPFTLAAVRLFLAPKGDFKPRSATEEDKLSAKMRRFHRFAGLQVDVGHFYTASMLAFAIAGMASLIIWLVWVVDGGHQLQVLNQRECSDGWLAPLECEHTFTYKGKNYVGCTMAGSDVNWCSHASEFSGTWSNCLACEESVVETYIAANETACTGDIVYRGGLSTTLEQCRAYCSSEATCNFVMYYGASGCNDAGCLSNGVSTTRCGLAAQCTASAALVTTFDLYKKTEERQSRLSDADKDELYIIWSTPLVLAISNFVFAVFTGARVFFHKAYTRTGVRVTELVSIEGTGTAEVLRERHAREQTESLSQLAMLVKLMGCLFIVVIGLLWVAGQLLYADSQVATMVMGLMGAFFLTFIVFTTLSLRRVVSHLWTWLAQLPLWGTARAVIRSDWCRALLLCPALPFIPLVLLMSMLNHFVRRRRGIYAQIAQLEAQEAKPQSLPVTAPDGGTTGSSTHPQRLDPDKLWMTPWVYQAIEEVRTWNRLSIIVKVYVLCAAFFVYTVCPLLLNLVLSWFNKVLLASGLSFEAIVAITFFTGVVAFLLPPVPGLTVYVFGGLMMASTCPYGFWWGAFINIILGWFLKLFACAVQQKCIGGLLGKSLWVRQAVGVHKVALRCIEAEMRRPGWTIGKVAILCGGPDWPTSVLAGMMNLSLFQCELGTLPIIFFIVPCSLSGSFYMKKGTSEVWDRSANLMIVTSVVVNLLLWALAAWAIQNQLERNYKELTRPLPQNVDLEWLDHKAQELRKEACVSWDAVPRLVRGMYLLGAACHIMVGQAYWWGYSYLFNHFEVSDDIDTLKSWYGDEGVVTFLGVLVLVAYLASWILFFQFVVWNWMATRHAKKETAAKLAKAEVAWKQEWLKNAEAWAPPEDMLPDTVEGATEDGAKEPGETAGDRQEYTSVCVSSV